MARTKKQQQITAGPEEYARIRAIVDDMIVKHRAQADRAGMLTKLTAETADECGLDRLREAIVMQAIEDYRDALFTVRTTGSYAKREAARIKADSCEVFFRGTWFQMLTGGKADGDAVIKALKQSERR